jgi:hypothetical protein
MGLALRATWAADSAFESVIDPADGRRQKFASEPPQLAMPVPFLRPGWVIWWRWVQRLRAGGALACHTARQCGWRPLNSTSERSLSLAMPLLTNDTSVTVQPTRPEPRVAYLSIA